MSEFTPGKWEADTLYGDHFAVFANEHVVADCFSNEANARLIAAAPKMYELMHFVFRRTGKTREEVLDAFMEIGRLLARIDGKDEAE